MHTTAPTKAVALDRDVFDWITGMPFNVLRPDGLGASSVASGGARGTKRLGARADFSVSAARSRRIEFS